MPSVSPLEHHMELNGSSGIMNGLTASNNSRKGKTISDLPPAPQHPTPDGDFRCGICNKTYSRRDLRDRHRRRCIKTAGQERQSKRKSCETCAQKKLRCSMTRPACSRCIQMRTPCQYPPSAILVHPPKTDDVQPLSNSGSRTSLSSPTPPASESIQPLQPTVPGDLTMSGLDELGTTPWDAFGPTADPMAQVYPESALLPTADFLSLGGLPWNDDFSTLTHSLGHDGDLIGSLGNQPSDSPSSLFAATKPTPASSFHPQPTPSLLSLSASTPDTLYPPSIPPIDTESPYSHSLDSKNCTQLMFARNFLPRTGPLSLPEMQYLHHEMFGLLREYPSLILQRDFWSPFIHHQLYRCSIGGMSEPMGIALACVSAHAGSIESNYGFVDRMINQEREKLVRNFQSHLDTQETCVAAIHAMCIYQILGLFGDNFLPAHVKQIPQMTESNLLRREESERQAELHNSFLLKMTRRLYKHHRPTLLLPHSAETDWERWKFTESLRRNLFFVNTINILGSKTRKLNEDYFEPLDDAMIMQLPLPAPESMWRACSEGEWLTARDGAMALQLLEPARTLCDLQAMEDQGALDVGGLGALTRVILACAKV